MVKRAPVESSQEEDEVDKVRILGQENLPLASIKLDVENVRKRGTEKKLDELMQSIERVGLIQPVVVYKHGDTYELVSGQRRLLAIAELRWTTIPAIIIGPPQATTRSVISLSENIQ